MTWTYCYHRDCGRAAAYRLVAVTNPWWRRLLRQQLRAWNVCAEHRGDFAAAQTRHRVVMRRVA